MLLVAAAEDGEAEEGEHDEKHVAELATLLPRRDLSRVSLLSEVVNATVEPVTVPVNMEFFEITELVLRMVLQVMSNDLILLSRLGLVLKSISCHDSGGLEGHEVFGVVAWVVLGAESSLCLLCVQIAHALHTTLH